MTDEKFCKICRSIYDVRYPDEVRKHKVFHDQILNGIRLSTLSTDQVIWSQEEKQILVVTGKSNIWQRKRAYQVAIRGKRDTDYDFSSYHYDDDQAKIFIYKSKDRAVSFVVMETMPRHRTFAKLVLEETIISDIEGKPAYGIRFIWTLSSYRRKGLASNLVIQACEFLHQSPDNIAWAYPLSESGKALAKRFYFDGVFVY